MKKKIVALLMAVAMCAQFTVQLAATSQPPESTNPAPAAETPVKEFWNMEENKPHGIPCNHSCSHEDTEVINKQDIKTPRLIQFNYSYSRFAA